MLIIRMMAVLINKNWILSSATAINNFIDKHRNEIYSISSLSNGLSDHDAQILTLNDLKFLNSPNYSVSTSDIN
jgi:hypothetical protein